jgi:hypothetical protein
LNFLHFCGSFSTLLDPNPYSQWRSRSSRPKWMWIWIHIPQHWFSHNL